MSGVGPAIASRPWIAYAALTLLAHPVLETLLFGDRALQTAHDVFDDDVPRLYSIAPDWLAHGPSLWDPHLTSGNALFAQFALSPLAPDVLFSFVLPPFLAYTLNAGLMAFLAGLAMHLFLRDSLRLPVLACFAGGVLSTFAFWHYIYGFAALLLPLALLWTERAVSPHRRRRDIAALAVLAGFLACSSQVQIVALVAGASLAWVVLISESVRAALIGAAQSFVPWLAGAALAAPVLLSLLVAVGSSQRTLWEFTIPASPIAAWRLQLLELLSAVPPARTTPGGPGDAAPRDGSWFPGLAGFALLSLSLVVPRPTRREKAILVLLFGVLLADLVALWLLQFQSGSGVFASFQFIRIRHLVPALLTINVALAVGWLARAEGPRLALPRLLAWAALLSLATVALLPQVVTVAETIGAWLEIGAPTVAPSQELAGWWLAAVAVAAGLTTLVLAGSVQAGRLAAGSARGAGLLAAILVVGLGVERAAFSRADMLLHPGMGTWADMVAPTDGHEFIAAQAGGGRVVSIIDHANRALSARLDAADGYETIYPLRYHALFGALLRPQLREAPDLSSYYNDFGNRAYLFNPRIRKPIADLLGIRWLLIAPSSAIDRTLAGKYTHPRPVGDGWVRRFLGEDRRIVYENPDAFPRAFLVHDWAIHESRGAAIRALDEAESAELRSTAHLVARDPGVAALGPALGPPPGGATGAGESATITLDSPDRVEIAVHLDRPGLLVLADTYARGWIAEVDTRPTTIVPVDVALRGIPLSAGDHVVVFRYRPIETLAGFGLAGATLLFGLVWLTLPWLRRRGARQPHVPLLPRVDTMDPDPRSTAAADRPGHLADRPGPGAPPGAG